MLESINSGIAKRNDKSEVVSMATNTGYSLLPVTTSIDECTHPCSYCSVILRGAILMK